MDKVNLADKFAQLPEVYVPRIVGELNGQLVKLVRFQGAYVWHSHADEDELFLVVEGAMRIELRDRVVQLAPGEFFIVPRGVEHKPVADVEALVMLFEPGATVNTGTVDHDYTIAAEDLERL